MAGAFSYEGVELRKLPPRFRVKLAQILDVDNSWKKLMSSIPSERYTGEPKYKVEHIDLIERHCLTTRKLPGEVLLDEWSTSGRVRPTVETLYSLLKDCQLYRAADYVATEFLDIPPPERPLEGPARSIPTPSDVNENIRLENNGNDDARRVSTASTMVVKDGTAIDLMLQKLTNFDYTKGNPINFDIRIIEKATNNFQNPIGSGAFGTVYSLDLRPKGPKLAVKHFHVTSTVIEEQFVTEIKVLSEYRHENLVSLIGFCTNGPRYCLVYEFMSGGSLLTAIASEGSPLSWGARFEILLGIIRGMHYLHTAQEKPLIHRDIKSANILLEPLGSSNSGRFKAKIGDFGLAKSLTSPNQTSALVSTIFGTGLYMAPEAFRGDISPKMDVFSYGVILLESLTGLPPFDESREEGHDIVTYIEEKVEDGNILPWVDDRAGNIDPCIPTKIYDIAVRCLEDKRRRPTSVQVLEEIEAFLSNTFPESLTSTHQNWL